MRLGVPASIILVGLLLIPPFSLASTEPGVNSRGAEPNNDMASALRIQAGIIVADNLNISTDPADWFMLGAEKGKVLNVSLYTVDWPGLDASLEVYDASGARQGFSISAHRYETVMVLATWSCDYFIRVFIQPGGGAGDYDIVANVEQPRTAIAGGTYSGALRNDTDHPSDIYRIALKAGDLISANLSADPLPPPGNVSLDLWLMDVWSGSGFYTYLDMSWWSDPDEKVQGRAPHDGDYYIIVTAYFGAGRYRVDINVSAGPAGGDDFPPDARTVYSRGKYQDSVDQVQDHYDWYRLNMSPAEGGQLTVKVTLTSGWRTGIFELFLLDRELGIINGTTNYVFGRSNTTDRIDMVAEPPGGGVYYVMLMAKWGLNSSDPADLSDSTAAADYIISIDMPRNNRAPFVQNPLLVLGTDEDSPFGGIRLDEIFNDSDIPYGDILRFFARGSQHINVVVSGAMATLTPSPGWSGEEDVVFRAEDSVGAGCEMAVPVTVSNVNHPPFLANPPGIVQFTPGQAYPRFLDLWKVFSDPDLQEGDHLYFCVSHSALSIYIEPLGFLSSSTVVAPPGPYVLILRAQDRSGAAAEAYINISVLHVPRPPVAIAPVVRMEIDEDTPGYSPSLLGLFHDPDGESLTVLFSNAGSLNISRSDGGFLRIVPEPDWSGVEEVFLEAWDGEGLSANMTLIVTVRPVNDPPRILSRYPVENQSLSEGADMMLRITVSDAETPGNLSYRWTFDAKTVAASSTGGNVLALNKLAAGNHIITVSVADPEGQAVSWTWAVSVIGKSSEPALNATTVGNAGGAVIAVGFGSWILAFMAATENGKYAFFKLLVVPLYTKIRKEEVLDQFTRGRIYGMIESNPGVHYTLIKKKVGVGNGTLTYHLSTLEREGFVRSEWDGLYKRFYPSQMARSEGEVLELSRVQAELLGHIRTAPGISQKELSMRTGFSKRVISYHISRMTEARLIRIERDGKRMRCYVLEGAS
jgi:DNA-binding transcriptional ArsR family regulator